MEAWNAAPDHDTDPVVYSRRCRREFRRLRRLPDVYSRRLYVLVRREALRHDAEAMEPAFARFRSEIAQVVTHDAALISGRAAWRRIAKAHQALPPGRDFCAEVTAWRRRGYDMATIHAAYAEFHTIVAAFGPGPSRKVAAAADRMRELGVSEQLANRFEGDG